MKTIFVSLATTLLAVPAQAGLQVTTTAAMAKTSCAPRTLPVYFAPGSGELSPAAAAAIDAVAETFGPCELSHVETAAFAGDVASEARADALRAERQLRVRAALAEAGLLTDTALEQAGAEPVRTARALPGARRVEVTFHLSPPAMG